MSWPFDSIGIKDKKFQTNVWMAHGKNIRVFSVIGKENIGILKTLRELFLCSKGPHEFFSS